MSKQISPLRQRMIDDMAIRNMSPNMQKIYTRVVANFSSSAMPSERMRAFKAVPGTAETS